MWYFVIPSLLNEDLHPSDKKGFNNLVVMFWRLLARAFIINRLRAIWPKGYQAFGLKATKSKGYQAFW